MNMGMTFVFEDSASMHIVCGTNDSNINYIEDLFSCDIAVRGNTVFYTGENSNVSERLQSLLERLVHLSLINGNIDEQDIFMEYCNLDENALQSEQIVHINVGTKSIYPKGNRQREYIQAIKNSQIVFAVGPAGTGKTFLAVNYCLGELFAGRKQKIILTRPVVEAGESLGFLPGDLSQKLNPYLKPLYDSMEATVSPATVKRLEDSMQIEIAPLAYMRGRSISNACIILDEAQNTTKAQMKMFLTRLGENSCAIITGDVTQIDLPKPDSSGLVDACNRLENVPGISFVHFSSADTVRSRLVQRIINAYDKN